MFIRFQKRRWSGDHDYQLWPFTFSFSNYRSLGIKLDSGSAAHENPGCHLILQLYGFTIIMELPPVILPWRRKVMATGWDATTVARMGRNWYYDEHPREYGFNLSNGFLQLFYGRQTGDSETTQDWCWFLPWTQWRHVRYSLYDLEGNHYWTEQNGRYSYDERFAKEEECPSVSFEFDDYDGERITARTHIEEREWHAGEGWFKWLSVFRKANINRMLDIDFSKETGREKGSWKGGTTGHGIDMRPGELHESAFRRYCAEHRMTFIGQVPHVVKAGYLGNISSAGADPDVP